jgi:hypothetical protein
VNTNHFPDPTGYTIPLEVKPMSIGKRVALAAAGSLVVGAALGLAAFAHTDALPHGAAATIMAPASSANPGPSAPSSSTIAISYPCPTNPPTNPYKSPGTRNPIRPAAWDPCGADGSVSGPDGGGTGNTGVNPGPVETGNDPGDPPTPPSQGQGAGGSGGANNCVGDEIVCRQPF